MSWEDVLKRSVLNNQLGEFIEYLQMTPPEFDNETSFIGVKRVEPTEEIPFPTVTIKVREPVEAKITKRELSKYAKNTVEEDGEILINGIVIGEYFEEGGDILINQSRSITDSQIQEVFDYFVNNITDEELATYKEELPQMFSSAQSYSQSQNFWENAFRNSRRD